MATAATTATTTTMTITTVVVTNTACRVTDAEDILQRRVRAESQHALRDIRPFVTDFPSEIHRVNDRPTVPHLPPPHTDHGNFDFSRWRRAAIGPMDAHAHAPLSVSRQGVNRAQKVQIVTKGTLRSTLFSLRKRKIPRPDWFVKRLEAKIASNGMHPSVGSTVKLARFRWSITIKC